MVVGHAHERRHAAAVEREGVADLGVKGGDAVAAAAGDAFGAAGQDVALDVRMAPFVAGARRHVRADLGPVAAIQRQPGSLAPGLAAIMVEIGLGVGPRQGKTENAVVRDAMVNAQLAAIQARIGAGETGLLQLAGAAHHLHPYAAARARERQLVDAV